MEKVELLSVKIDNLSLQEILEKIKNFIASKEKYFIVTPNPEFLVAAHADKQFREILNYADIAIPDGVGLTIAAKLHGQRLQRLTGVDLVGFLCELAEEKKWPIFLLGGKSGTVEKTVEVLRETFPNINIAGTHEGGMVDLHGQSDKNQEIIEAINKTKPKILLVAFGQIKQEKWIFHHLDQLESVSIAIGVGGTFDYISGNVKRAPLTLRNLGLEWLYRLIKEPWRARRIFNAIFIYNYLIFKEKFFSKKDAKPEN